ncbi:ABC transporter ATP-binding protein [Citromicrobium bathyomarinum]
MASVTIEISNITKRFGRYLALDDVSISLAEGSLVGLVGPNGAGKTTLMRVCAGVISGGRAMAIGQDGNTRPARVSALFNNRDLYDHLSGYDNLKLECVLQRRDTNEIARLSEYLGLHAFLRKKVGTYSLGMRQRLAFARALVSPPDLLLLDEPTIGLDPSAKEEIFQLLQKLRCDGVAILMSSHDLGDLERLADAYVLLRSGKVVATADLGDPTAIRGAAIVRTSDARAAAALLAKSGYLVRALPDGQLEVRPEARPLKPDHIARLLVGEDVALYHLTSNDRSLKAFITANGGFGG